MPRTVTAAEMSVPSRRSPDGMTASHVQVYVTVVDQKTGAVLRTPGPSPSAAGTVFRPTPPSTAEEKGPSVHGHPG